ncbi:hypothetical protein [Caballeronia zhejiangensis]|uniref:hypothetical protein n=1 Tax=Caballeronia zhejiangensis TaxID=871203 RepID=UPI001EF738B6|nr:hypothetical protein [Caballeronia zhejiangensis]MCG7399695.1 hypothetical protein [Caballeronia zhejiangensis]
MAATNATTAATARQIEAYSQYRDALIQYLFLAKARQCLGQVGSLEGTSDRALRKRFEDRFQRLTDRQAKLEIVLIGFMNNPLITHRKNRSRMIHATKQQMTSVPMTAGTTGADGISYGIATFDSGSRFATDTSVDDWQFSPDSSPSTNINGLPMVGNIDIHGNPYGSTAFDSNNGF